MEKLMIASTLLLMMCGMTWGHGMMTQPVQRSTMWRDSRFPNAPRNYDDNALYCGGFSRQHRLNHGKCGVCGDAYDAPHPQPNEAGGEFATGVIVETYQQGQVIDVSVKITANHMGYFVFKLCPNNDVHKAVTQECLDQHVLRAVGENGEDLGEKYYIDSAVNTKHLKLQLPPEVTCSQCVLQWHYFTANSWGCDNDRCCVGCGPQENFVNCADVAITGSGGPVYPHHTNAPTTEQPRVTDAPTTPRRTTQTPRPTTTTPRPTVAPTETPRPTAAPITTRRPATDAPTTTTRKPTHAPSHQGPGSNCEPIGVYARMSGMKAWCQTNCARQYCPATHCRCH